MYDADLPEPRSTDADAMARLLAGLLREQLPEIVGIEGTWPSVREFAATLPTDDPDRLMADVAAVFDAEFDDISEVDGTADYVDEDPVRLREAVKRVHPEPLTPDAMLAALAMCKVEQTPAESLTQSVAWRTVSWAGKLLQWAVNAVVDEWHPGERHRRDEAGNATCELPASFDGAALPGNVEQHWPSADGAAWVEDLASAVHHEWPSAAEHVTQGDLEDALITWRRRGWHRPPAPEEALAVASGAPCPAAPTRALRAEWLRTRQRRGDVCTSLVQYAHEVAARRAGTARPQPKDSFPRRTQARARGRRTRTARARASGVRSGSDPGSSDPDQADPPQGASARWEGRT